MDVESPKAFLQHMDAKRALRVRCVREALERVSRHICCDPGVGSALDRVARDADDETLNAIGQMLKHIA